MAYKRAIEGKNNVKNKNYPKKKRFELSVPNVGMVLNQSYIETFVLNVGFVYYFSEEWGFGLDYTTASNSDKGERSCIENFYNDPSNQLADPCGDVSNLEELGDRSSTPPRNANYGPAYVPIREISSIITLNVTWVPVYGKQLIFFNNTNFFDLYFEFGGSLVSSTYYSQQEILRNGNASRGTFNEDGTQPNPPIGAEPNEFGSYGIEGRPDPIGESHVALNFGIGQKFHFLKRFHAKLYLRNMTLLGTENTFENLFALFGGFGARF